MNEICAICGRIHHDGHGRLDCQAQKPQAERRPARHERSPEALEDDYPASASGDEAGPASSPKTKGERPNKPRPLQGLRLIKPGAAPTIFGRAKLNLRLAIGRLKRELDALFRRPAPFDSMAFSFEPASNEIAGPESGPEKPVTLPARRSWPMPGVLDFEALAAPPVLIPVENAPDDFGRIFEFPALEPSPDALDFEPLAAPPILIPVGDAPCDFGRILEFAASGSRPPTTPASSQTGPRPPQPGETDSITAKIKEPPMFPNEPAEDIQASESGHKDPCNQPADGDHGEACCPACAPRPSIAALVKPDKVLIPKFSAKPNQDPASQEAPSCNQGEGDHGEACCPACAPRPSITTLVKPAEVLSPNEGAEPHKSQGSCCPACAERESITASIGESQDGDHDSGSPLLKLFIGTGLALVSEVGHFLEIMEWATITLAALAILIGGIPTWLAGWKSIRRGQLDIMALMSVAVTGAVFIGEFSEAALVLLLFALAEALEDRSVDKARRAIAGLLSLAPEMAFIDDGRGGLVEAKASEVPAGSRVRVRPGEKLALDGVVIEGASAIDQSPITGESVPVQKLPGDQVFAGTLNVSGVLDYEVSAPYGDSALARIVKTVAEAEGAKAPVERFVERFAKIYTPSVFILAIVVAVLPPLAFGGQWHDWIYRALALLVISCPCALVVSTPVAVLSALAAATKKGLLVKGGVHLEEGRRLTVVALDKTGTLTSGQLSRTGITSLNGFDLKESDRLAASLATLSNHPVSQAVARASEFKGEALATLSGFQDIPGLGVSAEFEGVAIALGNAQLAKKLGAMDDNLAAEIDALETEGQTVTILVRGEKAAALIATADTIKEDSRKAVSELKALGVKTVMLTGDNEAAAKAVAAKVGVDSYRAGLMPEEKLRVIEELGAEGKVGMAGDGINDAPALARADIGFSMGAAGTGTAIETADVAIMDDNLSKIPLFIRLSRAVHRILTQNIVFILLVKLTFIVVTLMGRTDMWMAVLADMGVCMLVIANSLKISRK